jgi:hypothetical protein
VFLGHALTDNPPYPPSTCSGGKLLRRLSNFQKTISCVRVSPLAGPDSAAAPRLLAGSLDGHVKVFELDDFRVTSASKYPAPVLSMGISPDCSLLAVGMTGGMLSVQKHARPRVMQVDTAGCSLGRRREGQAGLCPCVIGHVDSVMGQISGLACRLPCAIICLHAATVCGGLLLLLLLALVAVHLPS